MASFDASFQSSDPSVVVPIILGLFALYVIPAIINGFKLFAKAGKPGWYSIIPVYSSMVMAEIAGKPQWMGAAVGLLAIVSNIFKPLNIVWLVLGLILFNSFIKSYDRGIGFWILYLFFPIGAVFIVDKANYKGPAGLMGKAGAVPQQAQAVPQQFAQPQNPVQGAPYTQPLPPAPTDPNQQPPQQG